jgi:hypothetical protein
MADAAHVMNESDSKLSRANHVRIVELEAFQKNVENFVYDKLDKMEKQQDKMMNIVTSMQLQMTATDNSQQISELKQEFAKMKDDVTEIKKDMAIKQSWITFASPFISAGLMAAAIWALNMFF